MGRRPANLPPRARWIAKADEASEEGSNTTGTASTLLETEGFLFSAIAPSLIEAYQGTEYRVDGPQGFTLRIGQRSAELAAAHAAHRANCSAFITAWNPFSEATDDAVNRERQAQLWAELTRRGLHHEPGIGQHPSHQWPGEDSVLVFGLDQEAAKTLAHRFQQNAFVWAGADAVPQLILMR